jgi:hypothetical protein
MLVRYAVESPLTRSAVGEKGFDGGIALVGHLALDQSRVGDRIGRIDGGRWLHFGFGL